MLNEQAERFEALNSKFQQNRIIGNKQEILRFLLELSGASDEYGENVK